MADVIVTYPPARGSVIVRQTVGGSVTVVPGGDSSGGAGSTFQNVFIQQTDPAADIPYLWVVTDVDGHVIDLRKGPI